MGSYCSPSDGQGQYSNLDENVRNRNRIEDKKFKETFPEQIIVEKKLFELSGYNLNLLLENDLYTENWENNDKLDSEFKNAFKKYISSIDRCSLKAIVVMWSSIITNVLNLIENDKFDIDKLTSNKINGNNILSNEYKTDDASSLSLFPSMIKDTQILNESYNKLLKNELNPGKINTAFTMELNQFVGCYNILVNIISTPKDIKENKDDSNADQSAAVAGVPKARRTVINTRADWPKIFDHSGIDTSVGGVGGADVVTSESFVRKYICNRIKDQLEDAEFDFRKSLTAWNAVCFRVVGDVVVESESEMCEALYQDCVDAHNKINELKARHRSFGCGSFD